MKMKISLVNFFTGFVATIVLVSFVSISPAHSEETKGEAPAKTAEAGGGMGGMMGKMDMGHMQGMMHDCMAMHKDGKMCDHETMASCQKNMAKGDCMNMMKQAKKQNKDDKTK